MTVFHVTAVWDDSAGVWTVVDSDVLGLATEAETWPALIENILDLAPVLLRENGQISEQTGGEVPIEVMAKQVEQLRLQS